MNHKFSGYSVWIEPNDEDFYYSVLRDKMNSLVKRCNSYGVGGGSDHTSFVPHCTLLYSIPSDSDEDVLVESLIKARDDFRLRLDKEESAAAKSLKSNDTSVSPRDLDNEEQSRYNQIMCSPTSFYYFPYPKTADNGKGFGCLILMLLIEKSLQLSFLHHVVLSMFPKDERHGEEKSEFQPHMALCYAAESNAWLENERDLMESNSNLRHLLLPFHARYLSLWKTEGMLSEWRLVTKIEL